MDNFLSPAAQAVLDAYKNAPDLMVDGDSDEVERRLGIAAALRAAADQVVPVTTKPNDTFCCPPVDSIVWRRVAEIRRQILAIAAELEAHQ
jgi:hypothetical protein